MSLTGSRRFLQVHPTRRCNLRCLHCYSSSGPDQREELPLAMLRDAPMTPRLPVTTSRRSPAVSQPSTPSSLDCSSMPAAWE